MTHLFKDNCASRCQIVMRKNASNPQGGKSSFTGKIKTIFVKKNNLLIYDVQKLSGSTFFVKSPLQHVCDSP